MTEVIQDERNYLLISSRRVNLEEFAIATARILVGEILVLEVPVPFEAQLANYLQWLIRQGNFYRNPMNTRDGFNLLDDRSSCCFILYRAG